MAKSIENLSEEEIKKIFEIIEIHKTNGCLEYKTFENKQGYISWKNSKEQQVILTTSGIFTKEPPIKKQIPIRNQFPVAKYLIEQGYEIGEF